MKYLRIKSLLLTIASAAMIFTNPVSAVAAQDSFDAYELYPFSTQDNGSNPENRMAHNIYLDPDLSSTSRKFSGYSIEFKSNDDARGTYWSLCNFDMNGGSGAYAGFQNTDSGKNAIISFWENNGVNAQRIYPDTYSHEFGGEGEGTNSIVDYNWKAGQWYKMLLRSYEDSKYGHTVVEQWVEDMSTKKWTRLSAFDTQLTNSYMTGSMSAFMENFDSNTCSKLRSVQMRNIYVQEYGQSNWKYIGKVNMSFDTWYGNKKGGCVFGQTNDSFYGISCGAGEDRYENDPGVYYSGTFSVSATDSAPDLKLEENQEEKYYTICSRLDSRYGIYAGTGNLKLGVVNKNDSYVFTLEETEDGCYRIVNKKSGYALEANRYYSSAKGTGKHIKVRQKAISNSNYQKWNIVKNSDGYYFIINKATGLYLDVQDACARRNNNVNLFPRNSYYVAQDWIISEK